MTISEPVETMVLQSVVEVTRRILGERLEAVYAIGSLGHGGFVEAVSDVDIAGDDLLRKLRNPEEVFAEGVRATTKLVLFPVRFLYTAESGRVGSNEDAADWYLAGRARPSREVVAAAARWRRHGLPTAGDAPELTTAALAGVYREFCRDYARRLAPLGRSETIESLHTFDAELTATGLLA
jgi:hypothetical protein